MPKKDTRFQPGNKLWERRAKDGRERTYKTPELLWQGCIEYFKWVRDNPFLEEKASVSQGAAIHYSMKKMRAMTQVGLCLHLGIDRTTWENYRAIPEYFPVTARANDVIFEQKFGGAAADLLNANIIARDLGLADHKKLSGDEDNPIHMKHNPENVDRLALARSVLKILTPGEDKEDEI